MKPARIVTPKRDIVVVGASAGGVQALERLVSLLPASYAGIVLVVLHIRPEVHSSLPEILTRAGKLPAVHPEDREFLRAGHIYVAPPDQHLTIERDRIRLLRGPRENRHRPAVDPLFRSAALTYGPRVVGVILTGSLDDGTAGLYAIRSAGGLTIVQDPSEAAYPGMPQSAIDNVPVDYISTISEISAILTRVSQEGERPSPPPPPDFEQAAELRNMKLDQDTLEDPESHPGVPSVFSCPECHGTLWELRDGTLSHFRCRVGHAYTGQSLEVEKAHEVERALWAALRVIEESVTLQDLLARKAIARGDDTLASAYREESDRRSDAAGLIRDLLLRSESSNALEKEANQSS